MKREHLAVTASVEATSGPPTLSIEYDGPAATLTERLSGPGGDPYDAGDVDVAFRLQDESAGVLSISERLTGAFVCEVEAAGETIKRVVSAAQTDDERYRIEIQGQDDRWSVEKQTLLVYDDGGQLLRTCSLIPGGVEL